MPLRATPVDVVVPLLGDPSALLDSVSDLVAVWPEDVDARLVVPTGRVTRRDRDLLRSLGSDVRLVELEDAAPTFGALVAAAAADAGAPLVVLDASSLPDPQALRALAAGTAAPGGLVLAPDLARTPVLTAAHDLPSLRALATASSPLAQEDLTDAGEVCEPTFDPAVPVRPGSVSVVVPVWNQLAHTQACIASVRRSTRKPYEIVVVDNGSTDGTREWLAAQRDLVVVTNARNLGFAVACNQGIAASHGETVVLLNNDTVVPRFWADGLVRTLRTDPRVGAVGPRSNSVSGSQVVREADYADLTAFRPWADAWRRAHAGQSEEVRRLVGFCLALRREALLDVGGLDEGYGTGNFEDDDLCLRLRRAGWSLRVAHDVVVHHAGSATFRAAGSYSTAFAHGYRHHRAKWGAGMGEDVLLSAALIVKDEQAALPRCLESLRGVVDEVVVCDTGSSDRTVEIAEAFGARVVYAPWEGDFAAARNAVLAHCRGTWVFSVDADEQLTVAPDTDLRLLLLALEADAVAVTIRSRSDQEGGATFEHEGGRLFRRGALTWVGAVHETLVDGRTGRSPAYVPAPGLWLDHDGYVDHVYAERDKSLRNLLLAEKDHAQALACGDAGRTWKTAYELGRALSRTAGHEQRVTELMELALTGMPDGLGHLRCDAHVRLAVAQAGQQLLVEAEASARAALRCSPGDPAAVVVLAEVLAVLRRHAEALVVVEAHQVRDSASAIRDLGKAAVDLPLLRARLLHALARPAESADVLLALAAEHPSAVDWPLLHTVLADRPDRAAVLAALAARDVAPALAALDGLAEPDREALYAALADLGIDAQAWSPATLRASRLDAVLHGHDPAAVAEAALTLEDTDLVGALDLWRHVPDSDGARVAEARCLLQLGRTDEAVAAVEGIDVGGLPARDLLVVAAVAAAAGDRETAGLLLGQADRAAPDELVETVTALAQTLGLPLPDRVQPVP